MNTYYWRRVPITIQVERVVAYPDDEASEDPEVYGAPLPASPKPQSAPKGGTEPRVDTAYVAKQVHDLPHALLGWCSSDDMPEVVPVSASEATSEGVRLKVPPGAVPPSGRRAGLTAHRFWPRMVGQEQRVYTGWVSSDGAGKVVYAPHTRAGYKLPPSKAAFIIGSSSLALRMRAARKAGVAG